MTDLKTHLKASLKPCRTQLAACHAMARPPLTANFLPSSHTKCAQAAQGFLDKSDGRDKLLAAVQYAAMFIAAGSAGDAKKVQVSVATARKVFRIMRPLEALTPLVHSPGINANKPLIIEILNKLKPILMSIYFGGDHVVWLQQAGLMANKELTAKAQKASLYGWFGGSLCTVVTEIYEIQGKDKSKPSCCPYLIYHVSSHQCCCMPVLLTLFIFFPWQPSLPVSRVRARRTTPPARPRLMPR